MTGMDQRMYSVLGKQSPEPDDKLGADCTGRKNAEAFFKGERVVFNFCAESAQFFPDAEKKGMISCACKNREFLKFRNNEFAD